MVLLFPSYVASTFSLFSQIYGTIGDNFQFDPQREPEKGFILIGLGVGIIFIVLAVLRYYHKKRVKQTRPGERIAGDDKHAPSGPISESPRKTSGDDLNSPLKEMGASTTHKPATSRKVPLGNRLKRAKKKLSSGETYSRRSALKTFSIHMDELPQNISHIYDELEECFDHEDARVRKGALRLVEKGVVARVNMPRSLKASIYRNFVENDVGTLRLALKCLGKMASNSIVCAREILDIVEESYNADKFSMDAGADRYEKLVRTNELLETLGKFKPEVVSTIIPLVTQSLNYPIYRPETKDDDAEMLYVSTARVLAVLNRSSPRGVSPAIPKLIKVLGDTYIYKRWGGSGSEDMRKVFEDSFTAIVSRSPVHSVPYLMKSASTTNKVIKRIIRDTIDTMARRDPAGMVSILFSCLKLENEGARKNASAMLDNIIMMDPGMSARAVEKLLDERDPKILGYATNILSHLVEKVEGVLIADATPVFRMATHPNRRVRRSALQLLGKMAQKDGRWIKPTLKYMLRGLEQEGEVRLVSLSALSDLARSDENIRKLVLPHIILKLDDELEQVRWRASNVLKELGVAGDDVKHYKSARKQIDFVEPNLNELHHTTVLDLGDIRDELKSAKQMLRHANYVSADAHASRLKDMFINFKVALNPEMDLRLRDWKQFTLGVHTPFELLLLNLGLAHTYNLVVKFDADVEVTGNLPRVVKAGETCVISLAWTPQRDGRLPLKAILFFQDNKGVTHQKNKDIWVDVISSPSTSSTFSTMNSHSPSTDVFENLDWE